MYNLYPVLSRDLRLFVAVELSDHKREQGRSRGYQQNHRGHHSLPVAQHKRPDHGSHGDLCLRLVLLSISREFKITPEAKINIDKSC